MDRWTETPTLSTIPLFQYNHSITFEEGFLHMRMNIRIMSIMIKGIMEFMFFVGRKKVVVCTNVVRKVSVSTVHGACGPVWPADEPSQWHHEPGACGEFGLEVWQIEKFTSTFRETIFTKFLVSN
jgi:hypothetical protein